MGTKFPVHFSQQEIRSCIRGSTNLAHLTGCWECPLMGTVLHFCLFLTGQCRSSNQSAVSGVLLCPCDCNVHWRTDRSPICSRRLSLHPRGQELRQKVPIHFSSGLEPRVPYILNGTPMNKYYNAL